MLLFFAKEAIHAKEYEARWQFAAYLGSIKQKQTQAEFLLSLFLLDSNEYVKRRALSALGQLGSAKVHNFVDGAWLTGSEYQRMTVLEALYDIRSSQLPAYLKMALADGRPYVIATVQKIESQLANVADTQ
jgi:HEAT repeats